MSPNLKACVISSNAAKLGYPVCYGVLRILCLGGHYPIELLDPECSAPPTPMSD